MTETKAAYENPLIPNARVRQLYRAILRAHLLSQALPPVQRALTADRESALVSTSIDLGPADLISDALNTPVLDFLRGTPLNRALRPNGKSPAGRILADCGSASRLPAAADATARIWSALGAAAALKSAAALAKSAAARTDADSEAEVSGSSTDSAAEDSRVVLFYALSNEIPAAVWKSALAFAAQHDPPIIFVVLPAAPTQQRVAKNGVNGENPDLRAIAHHARVPALPVDAGDPVALYRVAQESVGHARIGGGPALIQCLSFALESPIRPPTRPAPRKPASPPTAVANLEHYILHRRIATKRWMESEANSFAAQIARLKAASK